MVCLLFHYEWIFWDHGKINELLDDLDALRVLHKYLLSLHRL